MTTKGIKYSKESKLKMSVWQKGVPKRAMPDEIKNKLSNSLRNYWQQKKEQLDKIPLPEYRVCISCKKEKSINDFHNKGINKKRSKCKVCENEATRSQYWKNPEKHRQRNTERYFKNPNKTKNRVLNKKYGISIDEYNRMYESQKGLCAICGVFKENLNVDHNHQTGKVRSLLCTRCNTALGGFSESESILMKAIEYIKRHAKP